MKFILIDPIVNNILEVEIKFKISDEQTVWPAGLHEVKIQAIQATVRYLCSLAQIEQQSKELFNRSNEQDS